MQYIDVTVKCAKETHELGKGVAKFLEKTMEALANGWQPGQDLPVIMTSALGDLVPSLEGAQLISGEYAADKNAVFNAIHHGLVDNLPKLFTAAPADDVIPV